MPKSYPRGPPRALSRLETCDSPHRSERDVPKRWSFSTATRSRQTRIDAPQRHPTRAPHSPARAIHRRSIEYHTALSPGTRTRWPADWIPRGSRNTLSSRRSVAVSMPGPIRNRSPETRISSMPAPTVRSSLAHRPTAASSHRLFLRLRHADSSDHPPLPNKWCSSASSNTSLHRAGMREALRRAGFHGPALPPAH